MQRNLVYIMIIITFLIFFSCNKEEDSSYAYTYYKISESLYPFLFDVGSYWIYENQDNYLIDSVILIGLDIDTFVIGPSGPGQGPEGEFHYYRMFYSSNLIGEYEEQLVRDLISRGLVYGGYVYIASKEVGDDMFNAKIAAIYDTIVINNIPYGNIVKMELKNDEYLETDMNLYYADSIGVTKKEILNSDSIVETWNILRYNVELYTMK